MARARTGWFIAGLLPLVVASASVVASAGGQVVPPPDRTEPRSENPRPIRVGVLTDNYPLSFTDGDQPVGFVVDLLAAIEEVMGLHFERVPGTTDVITRAFVSGDLDMLQTYADDPARESYADFSVPYLTMAGSIFARRDLRGIERLEDLRGRRVLVHRGSVGERLLIEAGLADTVVHVPSVEAALERLEAGEGDATLVTRLRGLMTVHRRGMRNVVAVGEPVPGYEVRYAFAVRDGDRHLLARLNEGLAIVERTGRASEIYQRWFGPVEPRRYSPFQIALAVSAGLAVALAVAVWSMKRQRVLSDRLREQEQQMHRAQKLEAIGTLSSGIAHDFNNILTTIIGNAELLQADLPRGAPAAEAAGDILSAAERAQRLVAQILTFSRRTEPRREVLNVSAVVEDAVRFLRATTPTTIAIRHRRPDEALHVDGDATQLHQALMNVGTNAAHAMRDAAGGSIDIFEQRITLDVAAAARVHVPPGEYACVTLRDTGCGIAPDVLPRVFDPFYTTKAPGEGTGLGLAVVLGVMQAHGGGVAVSSAQGLGTEVRLYLPLAPAPERPPEAQVPSQAAPARPTGRGQRVLLVDDEEPIVRSMTLVLRRLGYEVSGHTEPTEALAQFELHPQTIDVVITDLTMPDLGGLDVVQRVRQRRPDVPVLLVSGFIAEGDLARARALGVDAVIDKPLSVDALAHALDRCLTARRPAPSAPAT